MKRSILNRKWIRFVCLFVCISIIIISTNGYAWDRASVQKGIGSYVLASQTDDFMLSVSGASSYLIEPERAYPASNAFDGNYDNAWSEGAGGDGIGEQIFGCWLAVNRGCSVAGIAIRNGYQKTEDIFKKNNRPKDVTIYTSYGDYSVQLLDYRDGWQSIIFDSPYIINQDSFSVEIIINSVYSGYKYADTCITEIDLLIDNAGYNPQVGYQPDPSIGTVEQPFGESNFWDLYSDYVPFDGYSFASTTHTDGWVEGDYLFTAGCYYYTVVNCDSYVSLRKEASADTDRILKVPKGETVLVNGELNGWMLCLYNGRYGWIKSQYLSDGLQVEDISPDGYDVDAIAEQYIKRINETYGSGVISLANAFYVGNSGDGFDSSFFADISGNLNGELTWSGLIDNEANKWSLVYGYASLNVDYSRINETARLFAAVVSTMLNVDYEICESAIWKELMYADFSLQGDRKIVPFIEVDLGPALNDCVFIAQFNDGTKWQIEFSPPDNYVPDNYTPDSYAPDGNIPYGDRMTLYVVNCDEWVSLRAEPNTSSARLAKVPLGATVEDVAYYGGDFVYGHYDGWDGYILVDYLSVEPGVFIPTARPAPTPTARSEAKPTVSAPEPDQWTYYPDWNLTNDYRALQRGSSGEQVRKLQQALADLGYLEGKVDGKFGANTEKAVAAFQKNNQIYGSAGIATTMTQAILYHEDVYSAHQSNPAGYTNPGNHLSWDPDIGRYEDGSIGVCLWMRNDGDVPITAYILGIYAETVDGKRVYGDEWYWDWDCSEVRKGYSYENQISMQNLPNADKIGKVCVCVEEIYYADGRVYSSYGAPYAMECFEYWID